MANPFASPSPRRPGFVVGAVLQSALNVADLVRPQLLYFFGSVAAAAWNSLIAAPVNYP